MAQNTNQVSVNTTTPVLLWQTTTGVAPDPIHSLAGTSQTGIYMAGTNNDPLSIVMINLDPTNPAYLGPYNVTSGTGTKLPPGGSLTRSVVGNHSEFAISTGGTIVVAVEAGRQ